MKLIELTSGKFNSRRHKFRDNTWRRAVNTIETNVPPIWDSTLEQCEWRTMEKFKS